MAQVNIRTYDDLKERPNIIFEESALNMTTETDLPDPFYNTVNLNILRKSIKEANEGKLTAHELIER